MNEETIKALVNSIMKAVDKARAGQDKLTGKDIDNIISMYKPIEGRMTSTEPNLVNIEKAEVDERIISEIEEIMERGEE